MTAAILLNLHQAADATGMSEKTLRREINGGKLLAKRHGTRILVRPDDLKAWADALDDTKQ